MTSVAATCDLQTWNDGDAIILGVRGRVDVEAVHHLLDLAASVAASCRSVQIDLDGVDSLTEDAAALLLFRQAPWHQLPAGISLRTSRPPSRQAVLLAYARQRARNVPGS